MIEELLQELAGCQGRKEGLRAVKRYSLYPVMWHRTDLWIHSRRTAWITEELLSSLSDNLVDKKKTLLLALVHDDAEIIFGDINAGNKAKMSPEELADIARAERDAIPVLARRSPKTIAGYAYDALLLEAAKETLEMAVVDWADKRDAFGEALHELVSGNTAFAEHVTNEYGKIDVPTDYYFRYFENFTDRFPQSAIFFDGAHPWWRVPPRQAAREFVAHSKYPPYAAWRTLTETRGAPADRLALSRRSE